MKITVLLLVLMAAGCSTTTRLDRESASFDTMMAAERAVYTSTSAQCAESTKAGAALDQHPGDVTLNAAYIAALGKCLSAQKSQTDAIEAIQIKYDPRHANLARAGANYVRASADADQSCLFYDEDVAALAKEVSNDAWVTAHPQKMQEMYGKNVSQEVAKEASQEAATRAAIVKCEAAKIKTADALAALNALGPRSYTTTPTVAPAISTNNQLPPTPAPSWTAPSAPQIKILPSPAPNNKPAPTPQQLLCAGQQDSSLSCPGPNLPSPTSGPP